MPCRLPTVAQHRGKLLRALNNPHRHNPPHDDTPRASTPERKQVELAASHSVLRRLLSTCLVARDGGNYGRHKQGKLDHHHLCADLGPGRFGLRKVGEHNGPTEIPRQQLAGLDEAAAPALALNVAPGSAKQEFRNHRNDVTSSHRVPPSRTTLEQIAQRIADDALAARPRSEASVRQNEVLPEGARSVSVNLDSVALPKEELRSASPPPRPRRRTKPGVRKAPAHVYLDQRTAHVDTATVLDSNGGVLATRKYAILASGDHSRLFVDRMAGDGTLHREGPGVAVDLAQGGTPEAWHLERIGIARCGIAAPTPPAMNRSYLTARIVRQRPRNMHPHAVPHGGVAGLAVGSGVIGGFSKSFAGERARGSRQGRNDRGLRDTVILRALHLGGRHPQFSTHLACRYAGQVAST